MKNRCDGISCSTIIDEDSATYIEGEWYCESCMETNFTKCSACHEYIHVDDSHQCPETEVVLTKLTEHLNELLIEHQLNVPSAIHVVQFFMIISIKSFTTIAKLHKESIYSAILAASAEAFFSKELAEKILSDIDLITGKGEKV
tara:strand:- start:9608 stop:10039 length:432 start_codon:yes stop_codon:yes gene_type:complete